ncbi:MAG: prolipoprotein diacylglyceryl transferase [Pirellulales bacterium]|nr:prolipoprotein diacylglyceryl transferase [Pirellulales bacterium]
MCSELFRIPLHWLSIPVWDSVAPGALLAGLLCCGAIGTLLWGKRTNRSAEAWGYLPGLLLLAAAAVFLPKLFPGGLPIRGYGVMVLLGSLAGIWLAVLRAQQMRLHPDVIFSLAFGMFVCGIVGARLFYVVEYWNPRFQFDEWTNTLVKIVSFTQGGLVVYGALLGATIAFIVFVRRHRLPALAMADLIAPSLLVGLAFGRIGCLLNGCCYGGESAQWWAVTFPTESVLYQEQVVTGRMHGIELAFPADKPFALVAQIDPGSPAAQSGLTVGMRILRFNGAPTPYVDRELLRTIDKQVPLVLQTDDGQSIHLPAPDPRRRSLPVHPTQVYSAVNAGFLAWMLGTFYPFRRRDGEVAALMLTIYPISRFLLEIIRTDESAVFGTGLSISQNISLVLLAGALVFWVYLRRQEPGRAVLAPLGEHNTSRKPNAQAPRFRE